MAQITVKLTNGRKKRMTIINRDRDIVKTKLLEVQTQQRKMIPFSSQNWTVGAYLDYWLQNVMPYKLAPGTMDDYERSVRLHIKPAIGHIKLNELGVRDTQQALDKLERQGVAASNRRKFRRTLSSCLTHAMREELVFRNVAQVVKAPKETTKPIFPWTPAQARFFLEQVKDDPDFIIYLIFLTCGPRAGEMFGLCWSDIDFAHDQFLIRQQVTHVKGKLAIQKLKTEASRRPLPLIPIMKQAILELAAKNGIQLVPFDPNRELTAEGLIFTTSRGTPIDSNNFRKRKFYKLSGRYGLPRITLHNMRHTAATLLKDMGVPIKDIQEILGHTDISTTLKIYVHGSESIKRKGLTALSEGLTGAFTRIPVDAAGVYDNCSQNLQSNGEFLPQAENPPLLNILNSPFCTQAYENSKERSPAFAAAVISNNKQEQTHTNTP
jgi:integrase